MVSRLRALSDGDKASAMAFAAIVLSSILIASCIPDALHVAGDTDAGTMTAARYWFMTAGAVGAIAARVIADPWFGRAGQYGWLSAAVGCLMVTFLASLIGGTLALPLYGTMFGPLMMAVTLYTQPSLTVLWLGALLCSHLSSRTCHAERDCTFGRLNRTAGF